MIKMRTLVRKGEATEIPLDEDGNPGYVIIGFRLDRRAVLEQLSDDRIVIRQDGGPLTDRDFNHIVALLGEHSIYSKETSIRLDSGAVITRYCNSDISTSCFPCHLYRLAGDARTFFTLHSALIAAGYPYPEPKQERSTRSP